jgi:hypothetical protein
MVGSTLSDDDKAVANRRLRAGFVLLVAGSMALMSLSIGPTPLQVVTVFGVGIGVGLVLLWFVLRNLRAYRQNLR